MKSIIAGICALIAMGALWWFAPAMLVGAYDGNLAVLKIITHLLPGQLGAMAEVIARALGADHILVFFETSMMFRLLLSLL